VTDIIEAKPLLILGVRSPPTTSAPPASIKADSPAGG
jgi:hypothetical protein